MFVTKSELSSIRWSPRVNFIAFSPSGAKNEWMSHVLNLRKSTLIVDHFDWQSGNDGKGW